MTKWEQRGIEGFSKFTKTGRKQWNQHLDNMTVLEIKWKEFQLMTFQNYKMKLTNIEAGQLYTQKP